MASSSPTSRTPGQLRLAAIDLDGTLLAPDLTISPENRAAVAKLAATGIEVVLASGRHHASILPYARQLPGVHWIISVQGGEVSDLARTAVLSQSLFPPAVLPPVLAVQRALGVTAVFYTPDEILTEASPNPELGFYTDLTALRPVRVAESELRAAPIYKVVWIATAAGIDTLVRDPRVVAIDTQQVRTHARLYEFMPRGVSKASGLTVLARHLGITADNVVAFGDAENDVPMFEWAGESFVMDHGWPSARQRARRIAPAGPPESSLARAVDVLLQDAR